MMFRFPKFGRKKITGYIDPDEVFLDASNLPQFDVHQLEGKIERPIGKHVLLFLGGAFILLVILYSWRLAVLQIARGEEFANQSENNRLHHSLVFAERGVIYDRNGEMLAWNEANAELPFAKRLYSDIDGLSHVVGYIGYPLRDTGGNFYKTEFEGKDGVEKTLHGRLNGTNGLKIVETDALGDTQSESVLSRPADGENISLSVDAELTQALYGYIKDLSSQVGFDGGAGVMMDIETGEVIALTSFPEYDPQVLTNGTPKETIAAYVKDPRTPFLNRAVAGLYTPGSIVKPFVAIGALMEELISPAKQILSTGSISLPNPFVPGTFSVFRDWKAHGWVDMREAIAVSSDVYFYAVGGGFADQRGLGVTAIDKYVKLFGIGEKTGFPLPGEKEGVIPTPQWKQEHFEDGTWRIGDTYNTAIGQYGFQVTPLQMVRGIAAIASYGRLVEPVIEKDARGAAWQLDVPQDALTVVQEGMRLAVTQGTAAGLNVPYVKVAGKTGTAELGITKLYVNSWVVGYFPLEKPKYSFAVLMERGPRANTVGATSVMRQCLDWMKLNKPEYLQ